MGVRTFMVEAFNEHQITKIDRATCGMGDSCEEHHETDERGRKLHDPRPYTSTVEDIRRLDTGETVVTDAYTITQCQLPGAMFWTQWQDGAADRHESGSHLFVSGPQLQVILPNGTPWNIDSRASNCTLKDDFEHRCWVRHGEPPLLTVDKNGPTCSAGAGSIMSSGWNGGPDYHGFLTNGEFTP